MEPRQEVGRLHRRSASKSVKRSPSPLFIRVSNTTFPIFMFSGRFQAKSLVLLECLELLSLNRVEKNGSNTLRLIGTLVFLHEINWVCVRWSFFRLLQQLIKFESTTSSFLAQQHFPFGDEIVFKILVVLKPRNVQQAQNTTIHIE